MVPMTAGAALELVSARTLCNRLPIAFMCHVPRSLTPAGIGRRNAGDDAMLYDGYSGDRKRLLLTLENMVGSKCYNGNIQNWGPGGIWEGEGRQFRYPVTFRTPGGRNVRRKFADSSLPDEVVATGFYAFGANELLIILALDRVLTYLERHHGLEIQKVPLTASVIEEEP
jgi:hypothetical protein